MLCVLVLQTIGQKKVSGQRAAIIFTLEPVFGVVFAYLLLGAFNS
ncbi:EamA family transporter [Anaerobranca gottschalkii]